MCTPFEAMVSVSWSSRTFLSSSALLQRIDISARMALQGDITNDASGHHKGQSLLLLPAMWRGPHPESDWVRLLCSKGRNAFHQYSYQITKETLNWLKNNLQEFFFFKDSDKPDSAELTATYQSCSSSWIRSLPTPPPKSSKAHVAVHLPRNQTGKTNGFLQPCSPTPLY